MVEAGGGDRERRWPMTRVGAGNVWSGQRDTGQGGAFLLSPALWLIHNLSHTTMAKIVGDNLDYTLKRLAEDIPSEDIARELRERGVEVDGSAIRHLKIKKRDCIVRAAQEKGELSILTGLANKGQRIRKLKRYIAGLEKMLGGESLQFSGRATPLLDALLKAMKQLQQEMDPLEVNLNIGGQKDSPVETKDVTDRSAMIREVLEMARQMGVPVSGTES